MMAGACLMVSACNGGNGTTTASSSTQATQSASTQSQTQKEADAGRLAKQATFGATPDLINHMVSVGVSGWLDEQFAASGSTYSDIITATDVPGDICDNSSDPTCQYKYRTPNLIILRFYANTLSQPDQLRQRVAFALSQLLVAGASEAFGSPAGVGTLNQIFLDNAFGNYRDILSKVTFNGFMGSFLNMVDNSASGANENYAREFMQLFSIGPTKLNMDGTLALSSTGQPIANYTPDDVHAVARALTGWVYQYLPGNGSYLYYDYTKPLTPSPGNYDAGAKTFLGTTVPAGASQVASVNAVIDAVFNNPSLPPYVAKFLIQQLVTSNPSPAYVSRIATVFVNDGNNVRGNMKAVIRAILTDTEARTPPTGNSAGKVKEPILLMTSIARAAGLVSDGWAFTPYEGAMSQPVFRAPSVFNYYPPNNPLPQSSTLVSPASKLMTTASVVRRENFIYEWTIGLGVNNYAPYFTASVESGVPNPTGSSIDWSSWQALPDTAAMVDRIDLIMLNRTMTSAQRSALVAAANAITNADPRIQAMLRAQMLLYVVGTSPLFQVDR